MVNVSARISGGIQLKEELTAGGKEFVIVMIWAAILYILCGMLMSLFAGYAFIGGIISVIVFCVFGFFVLTHYTARFTYSLKDNSLRVNRMIGKRNKEVEVGIENIVGMYYGYKPVSYPKRPYCMRKSIVNKKHSLYIEYKDKDGSIRGLVIEPSEKLRKKITKLKDRVEKDD